MNERQDIAKDLVDLKKIINKYQTKLYSSNFNHLEETDEFLERDQTKEKTKFGWSYINQRK